LRQRAVEICLGDVMQPDVLRDGMISADVVYHLAGLTRALHVSDLIRINAQGTWNVACACAAQSRPPVLVVVSSLAAAGPARVGRIRAEGDPAAPVSDYGRSKRSAELAAEAWADRVPITIVRPGIVFGPGNREMLDMFRAIAAVGIHFIPTFAPPRLSLIHVADCVEILLRAAEQGTRVAPPRSAVARPEGNGHAPARPPGYYFACAPEHPDYAQLGRLTAEVLGRRHVFLFNLAEPIPWIAAGISELLCRWRGRPHILNLDKIREATVPSWASSPFAVQEDLGFTPPRSLRERLQETVAWYREHRWL
jgi:nucleoside-diphosphate-sugar epimerase